ncbi:metalloregulator ArsR/SmtB family transcription factor [Thermogutta sp.]|uniref:ArsR/SmtB family transcription factor n=1 Tax=Thermogutta sp. TaxID=1962930 RepID=UPI00321FC327
MSRPINTVSRILKSLAEPTRLRILVLLHHGELCLCEIAEALDLTGATVSRHLTILERAQLVRKQIRHRWHFFSLELDQLPPGWQKTVQTILDTVETDAQIAIDRERLKICLSRNRKYAACRSPEVPQPLVSLTCNEKV